jgi:hypothetical protein
MNVKQILDFLEERPGYQKEGKKRLSRILQSKGFKASIPDCEEALRLFKIEQSKYQKYREPEEIDIEVDLPEHLEIKSAWQTANGKTLYSYKPKKETPLDEFGRLKDDLLYSLSNLSRPKKTKKLPESDEFVLEISLPDLHFGKGSIEELKSEFANALYNILDKCVAVPLSKIILPVGNDGLNSEGLRKTTTKGTPQTDTVEWFESFRIYSQTLIEAVDLLSEIAPVEVVVIQGNHDYERMFYVGEVLQAYYSKNEKVSVDNSAEPRKHVTFGNVHIMYTHGDNEKHSELPIIMATEKSVEFALAKHREVHCGHFHKEMIVDDIRGIKIRFLPSICTTDEWHKKMGYQNYRCAQGLLWHKDRGLEAILQYNV